MPSDELNPHHPTTRAIHDHWHKLAALLMLKFKTRHVVITLADLSNLPGENITVQELGDGIHLRLVDNEEAARLARVHGGVSLS